MSITPNSERAGSAQLGGSIGRSDKETVRAKRALLVDDHGLFRGVLGIVLKRHTDFTDNVQAGTLAEAYQALNGPDGKVDLVIVDVEIPGGDGIRLVEELVKGSSDVPVVAVTTGADPGLRVLALEAGASEVLLTTASGAEIIDMVRRLGHG